MKVLNKITHLLIVTTIILVWVSKTVILQENIETLCMEIETVEEINSLNEQQLTIMKEEKLKLEERYQELEKLKNWLIVPNKDEFKEVVLIAKNLGYEETKKKCFSRYLQVQMMENYFTYISSEGVRKYKHSFLEKKMTSSENDWWDKFMYNSVDGEKIPTTDVVIPQEVLWPKQQLKNFLNAMGEVFIEEK